MRSYEITEKFCIVLSQMHEIVDSDEEFRDLKALFFCIVSENRRFSFRIKKYNQNGGRSTATTKYFFIEANKAQFQS